MKELSIKHVRSLADDLPTEVQQWHSVTEHDWRPSTPMTINTDFLINATIHECMMLNIIHDQLQQQDINFVNNEHYMYLYTFIHMYMNKISNGVYY